MILAIGLVILLVVLHRRGELGPLVWVGRPALAQAQAQPAIESAEHVLAARLADGQITADEYLERASLLREG